MIPSLPSPLSSSIRLLLKVLQILPTSPCKDDRLPFERFLARRNCCHFVDTILVVVVVVAIVVAIAAAVTTVTAATGVAAVAK